MCVLVVEDEAIIRFMMTQELGHEGFEYQDVANGDEALRLLEAETSAYSLLITDLQMPGRHDGAAVARSFRVRHPGIPVLFISGRLELLSGVEKGPQDAQLGKPFAPERLIALVRAMTAAGRPAS